MAELIKADQLKTRLKKVPEWELEKKHIERTFEFDDFSESIDFVNAVAEVSEEEEHHPDIDIRYNKVRLILSPTYSKTRRADKKQCFFQSEISGQPKSKIASARP